MVGATGTTKSVGGRDARNEECARALDQDAMNLETETRRGDPAGVFVDAQPCSGVAARSLSQAPWSSPDKSVRRSRSRNARRRRRRDEMFRRGSASGPGRQPSRWERHALAPRWRAANCAGSLCAARRPASALYRTWRPARRGLIAAILIMCIASSANACEWLHIGSPAQRCRDQIRRIHEPRANRSGVPGTPAASTGAAMGFSHGGRDWD